MAEHAAMEPMDLLGGHPVAIAVYERVLACLEGLGPVEVRTSRSQIAFRRRRGFASLWRPGQYLAHPQAEVVLSIALDHRLDSPRFKEVVQPAEGRWMHHLEVEDPDDIDDEVVGWLREAGDRAT